MVIVVAPRIPQSGPEETQGEDWAKKLNQQEGEAHCQETLYSDFNVTCNQPFHDSKLLKGNFSGTEPPPRPPTPVDHENRGGQESGFQCQRSSHLGWRSQEEQDSDSSSSSYSSSSSSKDRHEMRKHHRGHPHGFPPKFFGHHGPHYWGRFGFGKQLHRPAGPPPHFDFPKHGPPHHRGPPYHPPPSFHHRDHHGPPHHLPPPPPPPPHRHFDHHGPMNHPPAPPHPHHHKHHGPPPPPHRYDRHGPHHFDHHGPPPHPHHFHGHGHHDGPKGHGHRPPHHSRYGHKEDNFRPWYDFGDEKHRGFHGHLGHGQQKNTEKHHATRHDHSE